MYDFCSSVTGILSLGIIILGIIGYRKSMAEKAAPKDLSQTGSIPGEPDGEDTPDAENAESAKGTGNGEDTKAP